MDIFRPHYQPAQRIYDAFQDESKKRNSRALKEWQEKEILRVWKEARDYALEKDLNIVSIEQVKDCELCARGHCDYGSKWAYKISELMKPNE